VEEDEAGFAVEEDEAGFTVEEAGYYTVAGRG